MWDIFFLSHPEAQKDPDVGALRALLARIADAKEIVGAIEAANRIRRASGLPEIHYNA